MALAGPGPVVLELDDVSMTFPNGTVALRNVEMSIRAGTVHGLVGANGAGKSTAIKILSGALAPSGGSVVWHGDPVTWTGPGHARSRGISTIHQHVPLVPTLSVLENVYLERRGPRRTSSSTRTDFDRLCDTVGYWIDPDRLVGALSIGDRQMVGILQALSCGAALVVMDEPTASLGAEERDAVHAVVHRLRDEQGTAFLYTSHYLDEVLEITDHITVLRNGEVSADGPTEHFTEGGLVEAMVGTAVVLAGRAPRRLPDDAAPVVRVEHLSSPSGIADVSLQVHAGEIVGLAGLLGSGRSEILHAIYGADPAAVGTVIVNGRDVRRRRVGDTRVGMALVPEERNAQGLIGAEDIATNASLADFGAGMRFGLVSRSLEMQRGGAVIDELGVVAQGPASIVNHLSGGNAQKVLFGRWVLGDATVFLLDEPTHGIDVQAKSDIFRVVRELADRGCAVIVALSEFDELLAIATRIVVVHRGRLIRELVPAETSEPELLAIASGLLVEEPA